MIDLATEVSYWCHERALEELDAKYGNMPKQGSRAWRESRRNWIGGSEISAIMGINPWSKKKHVIAEKCELITGFSGSAATQWGKLFEHVGVAFLSTVFSIRKWHEYGSMDGIHMHQKYSPDGIAVVRLISEGGALRHLKSVIRWMLILFELKSPYASMPDGKIQKHYIPQITAGTLCTGVDAGLFVNNVFRTCSLDDLDMSGRCDLRESDIEKGVKFGPPLAAGVIFFEAGDVIAEDVDVVALFASGAAKISDISVVVFRDNVRRCAFIDAQWPILSDNPLILDKRAAEVKLQVLRDISRGSNALPWKLFISDMISVKGDKTEGEKYTAAIESSMAIIRDVSQHGSLKKRASAFRKYFPHVGDYVDKNMSILERDDISDSDA